MFIKMLEYMFQCHNICFVFNKYSCQKSLQIQTFPNAITVGKWEVWTKIPFRGKLKKTHLVVKPSTPLPIHSWQSNLSFQELKALRRRQPIQYRFLKSPKCLKYFSFFSDFFKRFEVLRWRALNLLLFCSSSETSLLAARKSSTFSRRYFLNVSWIL